MLTVKRWSACDGFCEVSPSISPLYPFIRGGCTLLNRLHSFCTTLATQLRIFVYVIWAACDSRPGLIAHLFLSWGLFAFPLFFGTIAVWWSCCAFDFFNLVWVLGSQGSRCWDCSVALAPKWHIWLIWTTQWWIADIDNYGGSDEFRRQLIQVGSPKCSVLSWKSAFLAIHSNIVFISHRRNYRLDWKGSEECDVMSRFFESFNTK